MLDGGMLNKWVLLRLALVVLNAIPLFASNAMGKSFSVLELSGVFIFCAVVIPALGLMAMMYGKLAGGAQGLAMKWSLPSWRKSPFTLTEPTQFFHLAAFIFISQGVSQALVRQEMRVNALSTGSLFLVIGMGLWLGTWLVAILLREKTV